MNVWCDLRKYFVFYLCPDDHDLRQLYGVRAHRVEHVLELVDHGNQGLHFETLVGLGMDENLGLQFSLYQWVLEAAFTSDREVGIRPRTGQKEQEVQQF